MNSPIPFDQLPDSDVADVGTGPAVVFSHGTLLDRTMFSSQTDALSGQYRTIAFTSRAGTSRFGTERSIGDLVQDCDDLVQERRLGRFVLVGMSVGGFMAIEYAQRYPEKIAGLILMATQADAYTPAERETFGALLDSLDTDGTIPEPVVQAFVPVIFSNRAIRERPELVARWRDEWTRRPARSLYGEYRSWIDKADEQPNLSRITAPVLVLHGENDQGITVDHAYAMHHGLPNSEIQVIPDAGHLVTEEQPTAVTGALAEWLDRKPVWEKV